MGTSANLVALALGPYGLFVASIDNLDLVLLPRDCHLIEVLFCFFKDALYAEEWCRDICLEEPVDLCEDFFDLFDLEAKHVPTRKLACLKDQGCTIFAFSNAHALDLDPGQAHVEVLTELCKPNDSDVCDNESTEISLLG